MMDEFLILNEHESLSFFLKSNNVTEDNFFTMDANALLLMVKDYQKYHDFKECYMVERNSKCVAISTLNSNVPLIDITNIQNYNDNFVEARKTSENDISTTNDKTSTNDKNSINVSLDINTEAMDIVLDDNPVEANKRKITKDNLSEVYENNDLFYMLNLDLPGQVVLGRYHNNKKLFDLQQVTDLFLYSKFNENAMELKLERTDFMYMKTQILQLFPHIENDYLFNLDETDGTDDSVSSSGYLYIRYKAVRKLLREAGFASDAEVSQEYINKQIKLGEKTQFDCLHYDDPNKYQYSDIILQWGNTFTNRILSLEGTKNSEIEKVSLAQYFESFGCICPPTQGLELLGYDFTKLLESWYKINKINKDPTYYADIFSRNWPRTVKDIISLIKTSGKRAQKQFYNDNKSLYECDKLSDLAALKTLLFILKTTKSRTEYEDLKKKANAPTSRRSKTKENLRGLAENSTSGEKSSAVKRRKVEAADIYSDETIEKSFILQIDGSEDLTTKKHEFENYLIEQNLELHPYIILYGDPAKTHYVY